MLMQSRTLSDLAVLLNHLPRRRLRLLLPDILVNHVHDVRLVVHQLVTLAWGLLRGLPRRLRLVRSKANRRRLRPREARLLELFRQKTSLGLLSRL